MKINIQDHKLVPKHEIMTEEEISDVFSETDYESIDLPKIKSDDPVVKAIDAKPGNI